MTKPKKECILQLPLDIVFTAGNLSPKAAFCTSSWMFGFPGGFSKSDCLDKCNMKTPADGEATNVDWLPAYAKHAFGGWYNTASKAFSAKRVVVLSIMQQSCVSVNMLPVMGTTGWDLSV